jgi:hypothetical protein
LTVSSEPLVAVNLEKGFHQQLGPDLIMVCGPREDWHTFVAAWHAVIDFYETLFAHESQLDPVLAGGGNSWDTVFLRIDSLPNGF